MIVIFLLLFQIVFAEETDVVQENRKYINSNVDRNTLTSFQQSIKDGQTIYNKKLAEISSPIHLLNPDRYEFYTFDDTGNLVKRLMTMTEIQKIVATTGELSPDLGDIVYKTNIDDVLSNVQSVLREEMGDNEPSNQQTNNVVLTILDDSVDNKTHYSTKAPQIFENNKQKVPLTNYIPQYSKITQKPISSTVYSSTMEYLFKNNPTKHYIVQSEKSTTQSIPTSSKLTTTTTKTPSKSTTKAKPTLTTVPIITTTFKSKTTPLVTSTITPKPISSTVSEKIYSPVPISVPFSTTQKFKTNIENYFQQLGETSPQENNLERINVNLTSNKNSTIKISTTTVRPTVAELPLQKNNLPLETFTPTKAQSSSTTYKVISVPSSTTPKIVSTTGIKTSVYSRPYSEIMSSSTEMLPISTKEVPMSTTVTKTEEIVTNLPATEANTNKLSSSSIEQKVTNTEAIVNRQQETTKMELLPVPTMQTMTVPIVQTTETPIETDNFVKISTSLDAQKTNYFLSTPPTIQSTTTLDTEISTLAKVPPTTDGLILEATTKDNDMEYLTNDLTPSEKTTTVQDTNILDKITTTNQPPATSLKETMLPTDNIVAETIDFDELRNSTTIPSVEISLVNSDKKDNFKADDASFIESTLIPASSTHLPKPAFLNIPQQTSGTTWVLVNLTTEVTNKEVYTKPSSTKGTTPKSTTAKTSTTTQKYSTVSDVSSPVELVAQPLQGIGLEYSVSRLDTDIYQFIQSCNEIAFRFWKTFSDLSSSNGAGKSILVSPFAATSFIAMVFLGARGTTSSEINELLRLDDMVTFNPHLLFKNITETLSDNEDIHIALAATVRQLYTDRSYGSIQNFYKERATQFYNGRIEEVGYTKIKSEFQNRTNNFVKEVTNGKVKDYLVNNRVFVRPPLSGVTTNIFETDCTGTSMEGRDGEINFVVLSSVRQRRVITLPAVVYNKNFLAGYEESLDATAVSLGSKDSTINVILVIPEKQGRTVHSDALARLEKRLVESSFKRGSWSRLLRALTPRANLEVQVPRFAHHSIVNVSRVWKQLGLKDLFQPKRADLRGMSSVSNKLYVTDLLQLNTFITCTSDNITETHHIETFSTLKSLGNSFSWGDTTGYSGRMKDNADKPKRRHYKAPYLSRQNNPSSRLRFDRPFLYFVRHNPTGLILHIGRFNPKLPP